MDAPERQQIIDLAHRLAIREGVDPSWIDHPVWTGMPSGAEAALEKAAKLREWAEAILTGELKPPAWLEKEDRTEEFRDPDSESILEIIEFTKYYEFEPGYFESLDLKAAARAWCDAEQKRIAPRPTAGEVRELAYRLSQLTFLPCPWVYCPDWASYPAENAPMFRIAAKYKQWAVDILAHESPPPEFLIRDDPIRWAPPPVVVPTDAKGPASLARASSRLRLRASPIVTAFLLHRAFGPSPPAHRHWPPPCRPGTGPMPPTAPSIRERKTQAPVSLFDNRIVKSTPPTRRMTFWAGSSAPRPGTTSASSSTARANIRPAAWPLRASW